ncbi:MAG: hypothetical protein A2Z31_00720 [candidate division NC10 bacterium RBG_16_65_8]|nr:MAG: hypothetical protein A2Z31_00720 [candidate division NC10 bacterium RBG_16_65_8]
MKRTMVLTGLAVVLAATFGMAFAAEEPPRVPPRGTEGPDIRLVVDLHRTACEGIRLACPVESRGVEGPEAR